MSDPASFTALGIPPLTYCFDAEFNKYYHLAPKLTFKQTNLMDPKKIINQMSKMTCCHEKSKSQMRVPWNGQWWCNFPWDHEYGNTGMENRFNRFLKYRYCIDWFRYGRHRVWFQNKNARYLYKIKPAKCESDLHTKGSLLQKFVKESLLQTNRKNRFACRS